SSYFLYKSFEDLNYNEAKIKVKNIKGLTNKIYCPYKVLTPFQIIKYFFGVKGFEMGLSELASSLIILDEIHAYDARTTALFLEILKILKNEYGAFIFIMSATLPSFLLNIFKEELNIDNLISFDHNELDTFTRHEVNILDGCVEDYLDSILEDIENSKKVLVVCNTVKKSQDVFNWFEDKGLDNISLLHGKFILKDRESIEKNLSDLDLLVGTQAIEVSLDISYDVLYTEPAPLDALIQRFGRINRVGWKNGLIKPVNVFSLGSDKDKYIYNISVVEKTLNVLRDESILFESKIQGLLDNVYADGYDKKDQKIFDNVKNNFSLQYDSLVPFINQKDSEKLFSKLFNSYEVVPIKFQCDYLDKIKNKEYFEAMAYTLSLTVNQFLRLSKENNVQLIEGTYFINCLYDSNLGLLIDEEESNYI
ncbi:MAG: CRISPR-associated helicase Cas3', partial [archaeon]|nr:CRISPR-associated helicase Cas3' [archaeon]